MDDGPDNPYSNNSVVKNTALNTESEAQRVGNLQLSRYWKISNPFSKHAVMGASPIQVPNDGHFSIQMSTLLYEYYTMSLVYRSYIMLVYRSYIMRRCQHWSSKAPHN